MQEGINKNKGLGKIPDLDISPIEYYKLIGDLNVLIQHEVSEKLFQNRESLGTAVTLVTTGSDSRLEKGSHASPLEIIAIFNSNINLDAYQQTLNEVLENVSSTKIAKIVEMKGTQSSLVNAYNGSRQPGRIADSRFLYGSPQEVKNNKVRLGEEIISLRNDEIDKIAGLKRSARKITESGANRIAGVDAIHFDLKSGTVFFNPEAYQLSFKVGPLRLVQNTLLIEEVKHTRREHDPNFISTLDSNIVGRLNQLSDDKRINLEKASVDEIAEHYSFFMRLYHKSERAYERDGKVAIQLTLAEVLEISKRLQALSLLMDKFVIKK